MPRLPKHDPLAVPASREEIFQWRLQQENKPITVRGLSLDADTGSISRFMLAVMHHPWYTGHLLRWKLGDNKSVDLDEDLARAIIEELQFARYERQQRVFDQWQKFKIHGATRRELKDWKP